MMKRSNILSIALFAGVLTFSYAGFFYSEYLARQEQQATAVRSPQITTPSARPDTIVHKPAAQSLAAAEETSATATPDRAGPGMASGSHGSAPEKLTARASSRRTGDAGPPSHTASTQNRRENTDAYSRSGTDGRKTAQTAAFAAPAGYTTSAVTETGYSNRSYSNTGSPPGTAGAAVPVQDTSSQPGAADSGSPVPNTAGDRTDDQPVSETSTSRNDGPRTFDESYLYNRPQYEETSMATPNCPSQLPQGSTEQDAELMQASYGCSYYQHCRNKNDGSGGVFCWWGYHASSS